MKIPALWFTKEGYGPDELALELQPLAAQEDGRTPARLGMRVRVGESDAVRPPLVLHAIAMVNGSFHLERARVEQLHGELGAWLAEASIGPRSA